MRRLVLLLLLVLSLPARAEDPVLDDLTREEIAAELAEATEVQKVCYGYDLDVDDSSGEGWAGRWAASYLGEGIDTSLGASCLNGYAVLHASIEYTSESSESEDSARWWIDSSFGNLGTRHLERLGLKSEDLLSDSKSESTLVNAVLALPVLVADLGHAAPVVSDPSDEPTPPTDAAATNRPGSDWWRENGAKLAVLLVLLAAAGIWASATTPDGWRRAKAVGRFVAERD